MKKSKKKVYRKKAKTKKILRIRGEIASHVERKFKDKNFREKIDHILKKYGIVALPLIYKSVIESQLSWDEWSEWQLNEPDVFQEIKDTLYNQARRNEFI